MLARECASARIIQSRWRLFCASRRSASTFPLGSARSDIHIPQPAHEADRSAEGVWGVLHTELAETTFTNSSLRTVAFPFVPGAATSIPAQPDEGADNLAVSVAAIPVYGDDAGGPVFALRQGLTPAGVPMEPAIYRTFALLSAAYRGCHKVEFKKLPSESEARAWIRRAAG